MVFMFELFQVIMFFINILKVVIIRSKFLEFFDHYDDGISVLSHVA